MEQIYRLISTLQKEFKKDKEFALLATSPKLLEFNIPQIHFTPIHSTNRRNK